MWNYTPKHPKKKSIVVIRCAQCKRDFGYQMYRGHDYKQYVGECPWCHAKIKAEI